MEGREKEREGEREGERKGRSEGEREDRKRGKKGGREGTIEGIKSIQMKVKLTIREEGAGLHGLPVSLPEVLHTVEHIWTEQEVQLPHSEDLVTHLDTVGGANVIVLIGEPDCVELCPQFQ